MPDMHDDDRPSHSRRLTVLVVLVLALAAFVRLYGLFGRGGVLLWDEGAALMEGRFVATGIRAVAWKAAGTLPGIPAPDTQQLREMIAGLEPEAVGKPGHVGLCALAILLFGDHTWAGALMSVIAGLVCVCLVYWFGRRVWGPTAGITAAFVLAVSPYFVAYSRMGLPEADFTAASLVVMILTWWLINTKRHRRPWSAVVVGLVCGVAFTVNYRAYMIIALAFAWLIGWCVRDKNVRLVIRQTVLMLVALAVPLLMVELMYQVEALIAQTVSPRADYHTYFNQLAWLASAHGTDPPTMKNWPTYFYLFGVWEGPGVILLAGGVITALARRRLADWMVLSFFVIPMLQWSIRVDGYARLAVVCLPMYALLAGIGVQHLATLRPQQWTRATVAVLLAAFAVWGLYRDANFMQVETSQRKALTVCRQRGSLPLVHTGPGTAIVHEDIYAVGQIIRLPQTPSEARMVLEDACADGGSLVAIDQQKFTTGTTLMHLDEYRRSAAYAIETDCEPIWQIPNQVGFFRLHCFEHNWGFYGTLEIFRKYRDTAQMIRLYTIEDALAALE